MAFHNVLVGFTKENISFPMPADLSFTSSILGPQYQGWVIGVFYGPAHRKKDFTMEAAGI